MRVFVPVYGLVYLLWRSEAGNHPWLFIYVVVIVSAWTILFLRARLGE